ncbi:MAG: hydantoinase/oxoprolinase family protein, partial [Rhodospirillales bacterium]|nr:hydantoinase/oxoprolinase family protein [Rhodospirillales bacterium]
PKVTTDYRLEATRIRYGYPVRVPVIDIVEIGAGGGSIAWFDEGGTLCVGPRSAGAAPGPACYGRGGAEPTVTDAKLITGVLNPANFAGGQFSLDVDLARAAMSKVADGLGCSVDEAAVAVIRLVDANMINALKLVSIQRGHDPRDFALMVGGGGGGMHGASLGRELGVKEIAVPRFPGLFSAWGMLATAPRRDFMLTALRRAEALEIAEVRDLFAELHAEAERHFRSEGGHDAFTTACHIDMRYSGQEHAVTVPIDLERTTRDTLLDAFHAAHERAYTFRLADTPVELVTFRLTATADVARPELTPWSADGRSAEAAARGGRTVDFGEDGRHETRIYDRDLLPPGFAADGPVIVEEPSSTTLVCPGQRVRVDELGFLRITEA